MGARRHGRASVVKASGDGRVDDEAPQERRQGSSLGWKDPRNLAASSVVVSVHTIGDALVVITSDNDDNIKGGIWREVIKAHARLKERGIVGGKVTLDSKWHAGPNDQTLVAFGRKPSDKNPTGLQGFHEKYILVIIDESAGVPAELWKRLNPCLEQDGRDLGRGEPTDPNSHFAKLCKPGSGWTVQQISACDTPV
jgi:hypothetical protein